MGKLSEGRSEDRCAELSEGLGNKSKDKAERAAREGKIVLISEDPEIAIFLGSDGDYVIIPYTYCSCKDFSLNVVTRKKRKACYHLFSFCLSKARGTFLKLPVSDPVELTSLIRETLMNTRAEGLRKLINISESSRKV